MKTEINLAAQRQIQKKRLRKFFLGSLVAFIGIFGITILILLYNLTLRIQISSLEDEEKDLTAQINTVGAKKNDSLILRERIAGIESVLSTRKNIDSQVVPVVNIAPISSTINGVSYKEGEVKLTLSSDNLLDLNSVIDSKIEELAAQEGNSIQSVEITSFSISEVDQTYSVTLTFYYKQNKGARP